MKMLTLVLLASALAVPAFAQNLDSAKACVIVYVKYDVNQPNLTIACDGEHVLTHFVRTEDKIENAALFRLDLFKSFQTLVNSSGQKNCKEYNYEKVWWANCFGS